MEQKGQGAGNIWNYKDMEQKGYGVEKHGGSRKDTESKGYVGRKDMKQKG